MTTVRDIYAFLGSIAPEEMAMEGDRIGLLCGHMDAEVSRILVALDASMDAAKEAKQVGAQLLLTHHPVFWNLTAVNDTYPAGNVLLYLAKNGIASLNAHTNLDCAPGGVNDCLAAALGLQNVSVIDPVGKDRRGRDYGLLRAGTAEKMQPEQFAETVKSRLMCEGLRWVSGGREIQRVAVGGGACADSLYRVAELSYDALVTADVKYHQFRDAADLGLTLVDAGHFQTENPVCTYLAQQVRAAFPQLEVLCAAQQKDCIKIMK